MARNNIRCQLALHGRPQPAEIDAHGASCKEDDALYAQKPQGHFESTRQIHGQENHRSVGLKPGSGIRYRCDVDVDEMLDFGAPRT
jgi:hypothetical protein